MLSRCAAHPLSTIMAENLSLQNFDWDAYEAQMQGTKNEVETSKYNETLNAIKDNEVVEGTVITINKREVVVNVGYKSDGIVPAAEFRYNPELKVGDKVEVYIQSQEDKKGQLVLSHKEARASRAWDRVNEAFNNGEIVTGYIKWRSKGGMIVDVLGMEAFLPGSQIDVKPIRDYDVFVGITMEFKIVKINQEFRNVVVSHKALIEAELEAQKKEIVEGAINTLFDKYPILNDVLNYYVANGNSLEGFGNVPDRSNIVIDDANEAQQENIIRTAWKERKMNGDVEAYINYLKASNILASTARNELKALQDSDAQRKKDYEAKAQEMENARVESIREYWAGVNDVISKRKIAGYEIPEQILITRDGKKLTATPKDFYHYLYDVDKEGKSAYARDFAKLTPEQKRDDEILRAYLTFVGGNYSNLVDLAIKEKEVKSLKLRAKEAPKTGVRVKTPANKKGNLDFGF